MDITRGSSEQGEDVTDPNTTFDVVVLGGGSGGYAAAFRATELGMSVALVEKDKLGGTCLHRGCIPTKALLHAGEVADLAREADQFGVQATFQGIDMKAVNGYKDNVVGRLYKGLQGLFRANKVTVFEGEGRLVGPTTVQVGDQRVTGRNLILATGSYSRTLPGLEIDGERVITSEHALLLDHVPSSVIVLGGGVPFGSDEVPRAQLAVLPGTSHEGMLERTDWLSSMILAFVKSFTATRQTTA